MGKTQLTPPHDCPLCDVLGRKGTVYYQWDEDNNEVCFCDTAGCPYPKAPSNEPSQDRKPNRAIVISDTKPPPSDVLK